MERKMKEKGKRKLSNSGYALLTAIIAVNIFAIMMFKARDMWDTVLQRDLELELLFRARQYANAIQFYQKKNANIPIKKMETLVEKKFLRRLYPDPMSDTGVWDIVMRDGRPGKKGLLVVPEEMLEQYIGQAIIVGVCSTSPEEGFREYRKKKKYNEWAVYAGDDPKKEMPELKYVAFGEDNDKDSGSGSEGSPKPGDDRSTGGDDSGRGRDGRDGRDGRRGDGRERE